MTSVNSKNEETQEIKFVNTLKEDLKTLEISWSHKKLSEERVAKHFLEILNSFSEVAQAEFFEAFEPVCADLEEHLASVGSNGAELWEEVWTLTTELIDLLLESLRMGSVESDKMEDLHSRIRRETNLRESEEEEFLEESGHNALREVNTNGSEIMRVQEENKMTGDVQVNPKELLAKAQEALLSGKGDDAKELALRAAEMIAEAEAEETRKKQEALKSQLEIVIHEESDAEASISEIREKTAEREKELASFNKRLADARASFEKRESECQEIKKEIENNEAEIAALKEKQKQSRERFEEAVPARDAAKRECSKVENESKDLPAEVESLRENLTETEERLKEIQRQKSEIEAELAKLNEKLAG